MLSERAEEAWKRTQSLTTIVTSDVTFEFTEDDWERGGIPQMFSSNFQMPDYPIPFKRTSPSPPPTGTNSGGIFTGHLRNRPITWSLDKKRFLKLFP